MSKPASACLRHSALGRPTSRAALSGEPLAVSGTRTAAHHIREPEQRESPPRHGDERRVPAREPDRGRARPAARPRGAGHPGTSTAGIARCSI